MWYIQRIDNFLKIFIDDEVKDFVPINLSEYFISIREKLYYKLNEEQSLRKTAKSLYIFLTPDEVVKYAKMMKSNSSDNCIHCYNIMILNLFDPELQLINTKRLKTNSNNC